MKRILINRALSDFVLILHFGPHDVYSHCYARVERKIHYTQIFCTIPLMSVCMYLNPQPFTEGRNPLMFCAALLFYTPCSAKHHPLSQWEITEDFDISDLI